METCTSEMSRYEYVSISRHEDTAEGFCGDLCYGIRTMPPEHLLQSNENILKSKYKRSNVGTHSRSIEMETGCFEESTRFDRSYCKLCSSAKRRTLVISLKYHCITHVTVHSRIENIFRITYYYHRTLRNT